jgi:hypothetical protein
MATDSITLNFATTQMAKRIWDSIAKNNGYKEEILDENGVLIPNPETRKMFSKEWLSKICKYQTVTCEGREAAEAARAIAEAAAIAEIEIT